LGAVGDVLTNLVSCFVVLRCAPFLDITFNTLKCCLSSQPQEEIAPTLYVVESEPMYDDDNEALLAMEIVKEEKEEEEDHPH
jgi:hypothetical protein